ncbi:hypothetical protein D3C72_1145260 [compost metagenome]
MFEELKSPLYATSIGLLIKGIQSHEEEEDSRREMHAPSKKVQAATVTTKEVSEQQQKEQGLLSWFKRFIKDGNEIDDASFLDKK